jgi:ABC-type arginine transport system ATPase subunit
MSRLFLAAPTQGTKPFSAGAELVRARTRAAIVGRNMGKVTLVLVLVVLLAAASGCLFLAYWHFDVPRTEVEKVLPDARFPK